MSAAGYCIVGGADISSSAGLAWPATAYNAGLTVDPPGLLLGSSMAMNMPAPAFSNSALQMQLEMLQYGAQAELPPVPVLPAASALQQGAPDAGLGAFDDLMLLQLQAAASMAAEPLAPTATAGGPQAQQVYDTTFPQGLELQLQPSAPVPVGQGYHAVDARGLSAVGGLPDAAIAAVAASGDEDVIDALAALLEQQLQALLLARQLGALGGVSGAVLGGGVGPAAVSSAF